MQNPATYAFALASDLERTGGGTVYLPGATHARRYVVGGLIAALAFPTRADALAYLANPRPSSVQGVTVSPFSDFVKRAEDAGADAVGVWEDTETGTVYLDANSLTDSAWAAIVQARSRGELAIWDTRAEREIRVS